MEFRQIQLTVTVNTCVIIVDCESGFFVVKRVNSQSITEASMVYQLSLPLLLLYNLTM